MERFWAWTVTVTELGFSQGSLKMVFPPVPLPQNGDGHISLPHGAFSQGLRSIIWQWSVKISRPSIHEIHLHGQKGYQPFFFLLLVSIYSFTSVPKNIIELSLTWWKNHVLFLSKKQTNQKAYLFIYNFSIYKTLFGNMANCYPDMIVGNIYNSVKWDWLILTCFSPNFL